MLPSTISQCIIICPLADLILSIIPTGEELSLQASVLLLGCEVLVGTIEAASHRVVTVSDTCKAYTVSRA
jgi:hypothetical protein